MLLGLFLAMAAASAPVDDNATPPGWKPASWFKKPSADDIHAVWPRKALLNGTNGQALLDCRVNVRGSTEDCKVIAETPPDQGFGAAALVLSRTSSSTRRQRRLAPCRPV